MARPDLDADLNFDDPATKRRFIQFVAPLRGHYKVSVTPEDPRRGNQQNRYFHGVICKALRDYLNAPEHGDGVRRLYNLDQCKSMIVTKVMGEIPVIDPATGEEVGTIRPSTAGLTVEQFSALIDGGIEWLESQFGIVGLRDLRPPSGAGRRLQHT